MSRNAAETVFRSYEAVLEEVDCRLDIVEGEVPSDLRGVLFRSGSGRMERGGVFYGHPFDGDGMISRFAFSDDGVRYRNRFVRTRWFLEEESAGRILYRNFGTNVPGGVARNLLRVRFKNSANTNVVFHAGRLLALWEGGLPHRLDPESLETFGEHTFEGALLDPGPLLSRVLGPERPFSAHPKVDPETGDLYNFGVLMGPRPRLALYRAGAGGSLETFAQVDLGALGFLHDFGLTRNWCVFFLCPLAFDLARMALGLKPVMYCAAFAPGRPTQVILVPRRGGAPVRVEADPCFVFHIANAYEDEEGRIVADGPRYGRFPEVAPFGELRAKGFGDFPPMFLTRFVIDPARRTVREERLSEIAAELPRIHPGRTASRHRTIWASAASREWSGPYLSAVSRVDADRRSTLLRDYAPDLTSEPVFVPRPGSVDEDDGYLLHTLYRAEEHRTDLLVLNAGDLTTVCRARLPHHQSPGFHGNWVEPEAFRRSAVADDLVEESSMCFPS